ncbi:tRNA-uridine aminocarboxypropyltransferase [Marinomonas dokdonensis]|uniref:tRNA-uridine aminocarboxypropyltransferase n=1 Tax=Marinomonas dokdonensis TaxID=328224 RepID=UPI0040558C91
MPARKTCCGCGYLVSQCVCPWVPSLTTSVQVVVLQDPKEAEHAKNTVNLLKLALPSVRCLNANDGNSIATFIQSIDAQNWRLIFPTQESQAVEKQSASVMSTINGVILLDATWRKAKKCYWTHESLQSLQAWNFASPPESEYAIRKSPDTNALSTLEACAYIVEQVTGDDMQALRNFMTSAQAWQWRHQPLHHRQK